MMRNYILFPVLLAFLSFGKNCFSQDTLNFISGKQVEAKVLQIDNDGYISYEIIKGRKVKTKFAEKEDVYSISYYNNKAEIIYRIDTANGYILDQDQMYNYIIGEQVAWKKHKVRKSVVGGGFLTGVISPVLGIYGILIPASYTTVISIVEPTIQYDVSKVPSDVNIAYYKLGYTNVAKSKNIKASIIAGISGILAGALIVTVFEIYSIDVKIKF